MKRRALFVSVLTGALAVLVAIPALGYQAPVDAPVVDRFRRPENHFGAGNRGIDFGTSSGDRVWASAEGIVTFAGQVGGELFVVVTHPDALRTTYAYLASIVVKVGDSVEAGQQIGVASDRLHFGARRGDEYIDPEQLIGDRAHLVHPRF